MPIWAAWLMKLASSTSQRDDGAGALADDVADRVERMFGVVVQAYDRDVG
jgi:hypothetical protein